MQNTAPKMQAKLISNGTMELWNGTITSRNHVCTTGHWVCTTEVPQHKI